MNKVRGIVMEVSGRRAILLTPKGDMVRVPCPPGTYPGQEIVSLTPRVKWGGIAAAVAASAAVLLCLFFLPGAPYFGHTGDRYAESYLVIDINPSLELTVNRDLQLTAYHAFNLEAEELLAVIGDEIELDSVIRLLINRSISLSYLDPGRNNNLVMVTLVDSGGTGLQPAHLAQLINEELELAGIDGFVGIFEAGPEARKRASSEALSLNHYLLWEALQSRGRATEKEQLRNNPLELLHEANTVMPGHVIEIKKGPGGRPQNPGIPDTVPDSDKPDAVPVPDWFKPEEPGRLN